MPILEVLLTGRVDEAAEAVGEARRIISAGIGAQPSQIVFTSGATESNNLAILGVARPDVLGRRRLVVSAVEHKCVLAAARRLGDRGWDIRIAPVFSDGLVDLGALVSS